MSESYKSIHIYHVTDTFDDRARGKIDGAYTTHKARLGIRDAGYSFIPGLNTIDIGISASEFISNTQRPDQLVIAVNCAPPDKKTGTVNNVRNYFFCAQLKNDVVVCGTSNGYEFSYVKPEIQELYRLTNTNILGSQFRSLEILPEHMLCFSDPEKRKELIAKGILERIDSIDEIVPSVPRQTHVHEVDNFRNVKLFPSLRDLQLLRQIEPEGRSIKFCFGTASIEAARQLVRTQDHLARNKDDTALVAPTLFAAPLDTNVLALKSSSKPLGKQHSSIPIIATMRERPAETPPRYTVPPVGAQVWLGPILH